ncbi:MAG: glycosyltransferase involved in cell wall biosynthesis [Psychromonas sp.]|jgi:glycosyltransferase involved in cell wall biosynthesis|uniref:glycosyltransferase n=1 Tax=Psychromonas sp. TaxID=1884585 RepID=UPI0039E40E68
MKRTIKKALKRTSFLNPFRSSPLFSQGVNESIQEEFPEMEAEKKGGNRLFISCLGKIASFNGGLTNSAIKRLKILSEINDYHDDRFVVFYCSEIEKTDFINSFFRKKHSLSDKIEFINAHDFVGSSEHGEIEVIPHKTLTDRNEGYRVNQIRLEYSHFLSHLLGLFISMQNESIVYMFMDVPLTPEYRLLLTDPRIRRVFFTHNEHLKVIDNDYHWKKTFYKARAYFHPIQDPRTYTVSFTKLQNKWIKNREGNKKNYKYIPHFYEASKELEIARENKIIWVGRITNEQKLIKLAISSYLLSGVNIPFEIYGTGPELDAMSKYVEDQQATDKIKFLGATNKVDEVFKSASLSLCISQYEGFGLSILESLANGCPVICSNVVYGPLEMVDNDKNGYLVENNEEVIAEHIKKFFDEDKYSEFSIAAKKSAANYSRNNFVNKWKAFISEADKPMEIKPLATPNCVATVSLESLLIEIPNFSQKTDVLLRIYTPCLTDFDEISLEIGVNQISLNSLEGKLLSVTAKNDYRFKEYEITLLECQKVKYNSLKIPSPDNRMAVFRFLSVS